MGKKQLYIFCIGLIFLIALSVRLYASSTEIPASITEQELYDQCKRLFSEGKFARTGQYIEHFRSIYPESLHVPEILFMQAFLQPNIDAAIETYQGIIEKYPNSKWVAKSHFQLGQCYFLSGKYDKALDRYGKIIVSYPDDQNYWLARYWKCKSLIAGGSYEEAIASLRSLAISGQKEISKDIILMALGNCHIGMKDYKSAASVYQSLIESRPGSHRTPSAYLLLAKSHQNLGDIEEAKKLYQKVIEGYSQSIEAQQAQKYINSFTAASFKTPKQPSVAPQPQEGEKFFTIQVGAFSKSRNAENLANKIRKKGYSVAVVPPVAGKSRLYKVRVGMFKTRSGAQESARKLARNEKLDTEVVSQ